MSVGKIFKGVAAVAVIAAVAVGGYYYYKYNAQKTAEMEEYLNKDTMFDGISVNGVDVALMSYEDALDKVIKKAGIDEDASIIVNVEDKSFELSLKDVDADYDFKSAVDEAYSIGRKGSVKERYKAVMNAEEKGVDIMADYYFDADKAEKFVSEIKANSDTVKQDSEITKVDGRFTITDEVYGVDVDEALTLDAVVTAIKTGASAEIDAAYSVDEPAVKKADIEKSTSLIGSYYTTFSRGYTNRNINLQVGCDYINGTILAPGEEFSMSEALGEQTYENGYRNAAVFANGKTVDGMGGGVCQISTTLYNAVIRAELEVSQRMNHSLPVSYVPLGLDAAIAEGYKDFKFVNSTDYPIYIEAYLDDNKLVSNVYGYEEHDEGRTVEFETVYISSIPKPAEKVTEDPERPEGEREVTYEGKIGHIVETYKKVYEDGKLISREFFARSKYNAVADEVTVGTKVAEGTVIPILPSTGEGELPDEENPVPVEEEDLTDEPETDVEAPEINTEEEPVSEGNEVPVIGIQ